MDNVNLKRIAQDDLDEILKRLKNGMLGDTIIYIEQRKLDWHDVNLQSEHLLRAWFAGYCPSCAAQGSAIKLCYSEDFIAAGSDSYCQHCGQIWSRDRFGRHLIFGRSNNKAIISFLVNEKKTLPKEILETISGREEEGLNVS